MKYVLLLGLLLISLPLTFAYEITEIMYDPLGSDSNREWVEIYGKPLDDVKFIEGNTVHDLEYVQGSCVSFCVSIIADDAQQFLEEYGIDTTVLVYEAGWSSLRNTGEYVALAGNESVLTELLYEPISQSGESLQLIEDVYISAQPTPGFVSLSEVEEVPEFGVLGALIILGVIGVCIARNRKD